MTILYKLVNVSKINKRKNIETRTLDDINLDINEGKAIIMVGPSGSGKSTLLNVLLCVDNVSSGNIYYKNMDICLLNEDNKIEYIRELIKEYSNKNVNNLDNLFKEVAYEDKPKKYSLKKH